MATEVSILSVHTPSSSFALVHSFSEESLDDFFNKLSGKIHAEYFGAVVGPGWLKYDWRETVWNLDDDGDYTILKIRLNPAQGSNTTPALIEPPVFHLHNPTEPLPTPPAYCNLAYFTFRTAAAASDRNASPAPSTQRGSQPTKSLRTGRSKSTSGHIPEPIVPQHKRDFDRFHSQNGVRTVIGTFGTVPNVRMLLKSDHRHVYVARKFAIEHGLIPRNAAPGSFGYTGLVNIGKWPITLGRTPPADDAEAALSRTVTATVYLSEEPHFDVILGRAFFEARRVRVDPIDPTDVRCMDTGERVECEVVVLRDGKGEIVTVT